MDQQQTERWLSRHGSDPQAPHMEHALSVEFDRLHEESQRTYCNQSVRHTNRFFYNGGTYVGQTVLEADTPGFLLVLSEGPCYEMMLPDDLDQPIRATGTDRAFVYAGLFASLFVLKMATSLPGASPVAFLLFTIAGGLFAGLALIGVVDFAIPAWRTQRFLQSVDEPVVLRTRMFDGYDEVVDSSMGGTDALETPESYCVECSSLSVPKLNELIDRIEREGARTVADRRRERLVDFAERCRGEDGEDICRRIPLRYKHIGGHDSALIDIHRFNMPGVVADNRSLRLSFSALHKITLQEDPPCRMVIHQYGERETIVYHPDWFDTADDRRKKPEAMRDEARRVMLYESRFLLALSSVRDFG